jgi:hypothetical protein
MQLLNRSITKGLSCKYVLHLFYLQGVVHGARGGWRGDRRVHRRVALNPPDAANEENCKTLSHLRYSSQLQVS